MPFVPLLYAYPWSACTVSISVNTVGQSKSRIRKCFSAVCRKEEVEGETMHGAGAGDMHSLHYSRSDQIVPPASLRTVSF